jgi:hypothetical protein
MIGGKDTLKPQQLRMADTINLHRDAHVLELPRRASKTTTIFMLLIGRCASRPGYQVTFSAQSGVASSRRFREWANRLDRINPPDEFNPFARKQPKATGSARMLALFGDTSLAEAEPPPGRGFRILKGAANTRIEFDNGSSFIVLKPDPEAYRGEAADVSWIDEAQEVGPQDGDDLLAAILPLQDTKEGAMLIISGTAGPSRVGLFWDFLKRGRAGDENVGILDYAAPESTPWEDITTEAVAMALLVLCHPGIGTLTTMDKMLKNYRSMGKPQWAQEYLSIWPESFGVTAIPSDLWERAGLEKMKARPPRIAFAWDTSPGGGASAIVAAWRDSRGIAYIEVVEHRQGTVWLPKRGQELSKTYRGSTLAYDDIGEGKATATEMASLRPKPRTRVSTYRDGASGCVQIMRDLENGKIRHFNQVGLNEAAGRAAKREVRGEQGVWLWGLTASGGDITTLVAATKALRNWDQHFASKPAGISTPIMGE